MQSVRIYEIPACRMVSSGAGMFGDEAFARFEAWMAAQPRGIFPKDFLYWDAERQGFCWLYLCEDGTDVPDGLEIVDFPGGLYAAAADIDQRTDTAAMQAEVDAFLAENGLVRDSTRPELGHIITPPSARAILGYEQMDYWTPVRAEAADFR